jgi:hypothetical protein
MNTPATFAARLLRLLGSGGPAPEPSAPHKPASGPAMDARIPQRDVGVLLLRRAYSLHNRHRGRADRYLAVHSILSKGR